MQTVMRMDPSEHVRPIKENGISRAFFAVSIILFGLSFVSLLVGALLPAAPS